LKAKKSKKFWKSFFGVSRICASCNEPFFCSGKCPPERWAGGIDREITAQIKTACYCPKCFLDNQERFTEQYKDHRKTVCIMK